jgi:hypothetical protein
VNGRWRKRNQAMPLDAWLAASMIDEALCVFGALMTSVLAGPSRVDEGLVGLLETTALDLLDDVSFLAPLSATAHSCPLARAAPEEEADDEAPLPCRAVAALIAYTNRLAAIAVVLRDRGHEAATAFAERAAVAEARIARLEP